MPVPTLSKNNEKSGLIIKKRKIPRTPNTIERKINLIRLADKRAVFEKKLK
jgi:ribosomal protein S12